MHPLDPAWVSGEPAIGKNSYRTFSQEVRPSEPAYLNGGTTYGSEPENASVAHVMQPEKGNILLFLVSFIFTSKSAKLSENCENPIEIIRDALKLTNIVTKSARTDSCVFM